MGRPARGCPANRGDRVLGWAAQHAGSCPPGPPGRAAARSPPASPSRAVPPSAPAPRRGRLQQGLPPHFPSPDCLGPPAPRLRLPGPRRSLPQRQCPQPERNGDAGRGAGPGKAAVRVANAWQTRSSRDSGASISGLSGSTRPATRDDTRHRPLPGARTRASSHGGVFSRFPPHVKSLSALRGRPCPYPELLREASAPATRGLQGTRESASDPGRGG